jgi:hypothetical protein
VTHYNLKVRNAWNDFDRDKVAQMLLRRFPNLSIDKLLAAIRDCDHEVKPPEGWEALADCTSAHLQKIGGAGTTAV